MAQVGKVQAITGIVTARTENGQVRELQVGDFIYENEIITTSADANLSIVGEDGSVISLAGNDQLLVDESVFGDIDPRDAVIQEVAELQEAIVEALAQNQNIDEITDDPAAGGLIDSYDFQTTYHAGDDSKGQVGAYLLGSNNETTTYEYNQYIADSPDEEIQAGASPLSSPQAPAIPGTPEATAPTPTPTPTQPPVIIITDEDADITSADNSVAEGSGTTTSGSILISAEAGVAAVTIAGQDISNATASPVVIIGTEGTLTITGYNPATGTITYSYEEDGEAADHRAGDDSVVDQFSILVTDATGASSSDVLDIQIIDTAPVANPDSVTISEDLATPIIGNVITGTGADTLGADVTKVTGITGGNVGEEFSTNYGTLIINEDGSYIYELAPGNPDVQSLNDGETLTEEFTYTITDADGDESLTTLTITIDGVTDGAPTISVDDADADVTPADNSVVEGSGDTVNGAITVGAEAGVDTVTIGGEDITDATNNPVTIDGEQGTLLVTGYDPATGEITYEYTEDGDPETHDATDTNIVDQFVVEVTDVTGQTATDTLDIQIIDTAPEAVDDANSVDEDTTAPVLGNVITAGTGTDTLGADTPTLVTAIAAGTVAGSVGTALAGEYGTLTLEEDGSYSYQLDNSNPDVQSLDDGHTIQDVFTYTITDADGDTSEATLTIDVNGVTDGAPTISVDDADADVTPADNSVVEGSGDTVNGAITVGAEAGVDTVTIGGTDITDATNNPVTIDGTEGTLVVTGYNPATGEITYEYTEDGDAETHDATDTNIVDQFVVEVTDVTGQTATDTLDIQIIDTAPEAADDANSVDEDATAPVLGNVITTGTGSDTLGADSPTLVTAIAAGTVAGSVGSALAGEYGTLTLEEDGSYSYQLDNSNPDVQSLDDGDTIQDVFTYTITDADGDTSEATLTIDVNGVTDGAPTISVDDADADVTPADNSVVEGSGDTVNGAITVGAEAGISTVTIGGTDITDATNNPVTIDGTEGTLLVTGYDPATGEITYEYTEDGDAETHDATDTNIVDQFVVEVTDVTGQTATDTLDIQIIDTAPEAADDANSVDEDTTAPVLGNVITAGTGTDTLGADTPTLVTAIAAGTVAGSVGSALAGEYGTLTLEEYGSYSYQLDNSNPDVQSLDDGQTIQDVFTYTITDADGDTSEATLTIDVNGVTDGAPTISVDDADADVTPADNSVVEGSGDTVNGAITVGAEAGISTVTIGGTDITDATNNPVTIDGTEGTLLVTGYDPATGEITYEYTEDGDAETHDATDTNIVDQFVVEVTDVTGQTATDTLDIQIIDTAPEAADDANSVDEDTTAPVLGNVITAGTGTDTLGADTPTLVTAIAAGTVAGSVGSALAGEYGTLTLEEYGSYSYQLDNSNPDVQSLDDGQTIQDVFTYTITDADGDTSEATLTIDVNGVTDGAPTISVDDADADVTPADNSVVEGSGDTVNGAITVGAEAGISTVTIGGTDITDATNNPVTIDGEQGTLLVTGYDPATGEITYEYTEDGDAETHDATDTNIVDQFVVEVTDVTGESATDTLDIQIIDTAPEAADDANSVDEDATAPVLGNVITTGTGSDTLGADSPTLVTAIAAGAVAGSVGSALAGEYGTLTLEEDGSYSYQLDNSNPDVQSLDDGQTIQDVFTYTITDADGDTSEATLTIDVNGVTDGAPTISVDDADADVTPADNSVVEGSGDTVNGAITVGAEAGISTVTIGGTDITDATNNPVTIDGEQGTLLVTGYDPATGEITYEYTEDGDAETHDATDTNIVDQFVVEVTDVTGQTATDTLDIQIIDTAPEAADDANSVDEDTTAPVLGNVITAGTGTDTLGADTPTLVTAIAAGTVAGSVGSALAGEYGTLTLEEDGSYSYQLDNSNPDVQSLDDGQTIQDIFTYTITDADGDTSEATLTIDVNGKEDAPVATNDAIQIIEDMSNTTDLYTLTLDDFGTYSDIDGDELTEIRIDSLPTNGELLLNDVPVASDQVITVEDINNGNLQFDPTDNTDVDSSFTFSVNDRSLWSTESYTTTIEIEALADMPTVDITAENSFDQVINSGNLTQIDLGFTIEAFDKNGNPTTFSHNTSPEGFGVTGASSGANSELGYDSASGKSESIVVSFDEAISSVDVSFSWLSRTETVGYTFYNNGVEVGYGTEEYGSDGVDPAITLQPDTGVLFDQIVFDAPGVGDDYLIHSITFERTETIDTSLTINEYESVGLDISSALTDTDGSEELTLTLEGMPVDSVLSDGVNSAISSGEADAIDITGWDLSNLTLTPVLSGSGNTTIELTTTATATEISNGSSASATDTISINVITSIEATSDTSTVYESGLDVVGTDSDSDTETTTGNLLSNDRNLDTTTVISQIASNGNVANNATDGTLTVSTEHGTITVYTAAVDGHTAGDYVYTLTEVTDGDNVTDTVSYTIDDGTGTLSTTDLTINIVDDEPVVTSQTASIELGTISTNLIIIADRSGSMSGDIDLEEEAIEDLVDSYLVYGDVNVNLTTFAASASNSGWEENVDNTYSVNMRASGTTNYTEAMELAMTSAMTGTPTATQTIVYFMSDGQIYGTSNEQTFWNDSDTDGLSDLLVEWKHFIENETDMLFTIDMGGAAGDDLDAVALQADDFAGTSTTYGASSLIPDSIDNSGDVIVVEDLNDLADALITTTGLYGEVLGDTLTGSLVKYGADEGNISQIVVGDETYTYDGSQIVDSSNNVVSDSSSLEGVETSINGVTFAIDLETGSYIYSIDQTVSRTEFHTEDLGIQFTDGDGDTASTTLTFEINPSLAPVTATTAMTTMAFSDDVLDFSAITAADASSSDDSTDASTITVNQVLDTSDPLFADQNPDDTPADTTSTTDTESTSTGTDTSSGTGLFSDTSVDTTTTGAEDTSVTPAVVIDTDI